MERVLRRRIDQARFVLGGIQDPLDAKNKAGSRSIQQLDAALNLLADPELAADAGPSRPVFNRMNLSLAVMEAAKTFHTRWRGILGLDYNPDAPKAWVLIGGVDSALAWEVGHVGRLASQCAGGRSWAARFSLAGIPGWQPAGSAEGCWP